MYSCFCCNNYVKGFVLLAFDGMCVYLAVNIHHFVLSSLCACFIHSSVLDRDQVSLDIFELH